MPGCSSYLKSSFAESPFFSRLLSKLSSSFSRSSRTGGSSKGTYRLRETSHEDTESQRSLNEAVGLNHIKVQTDYKVDSQEGLAPYKPDIFPVTPNA